MSEMNPGLTEDPLFVGATRPPMRWGATYSALLFNMVFTMEAFLLTKNLLTLSCAPPSTASAFCCARGMRDSSTSCCFAPYAAAGAFGNWRLEGEQLFALLDDVAAAAPELAARSLHAGHDASIAMRRELTAADRSPTCARGFARHSYGIRRLFAGVSSRRGELRVQRRRGAQQLA